jgi:hydroxycarboxylate dehydrogenase B
VLDPAGFFPTDIARYVDFVKSSKPAAAGGEILLPGEPEVRMRAKRLAEGVPVPDTLDELIRGICERSGAPYLLRPNS